MTALHAIFLAQIAAAGPMRLDAYMSACLMHPEHGYYSTRDPFGVAGDFTTAPEISQMFGELVGLSLAQAWLDQGEPAPFALVELGPGRGTLMADMLRATRRVPGFSDAVRVHLVEASPALRARQADSLAGLEPAWHDSVGTLPDLPLFGIGNEFFDALPVRQFQRVADGWCERLVGAQDETLALGLGAKRTEPALDHRLQDTKDGDVVEWCPAAEAVVSGISAQLARQGGAFLVIDYGDWRSLGDTIQAVRSHEPVGLFETPGAADLSAHVDFEALARATAKGAAYSKLTPQGVFLDRLGITIRAQALAQAMTPDQLETHHAAFRRLTDADEMGTLFKVMAYYPDAAAPPPGCEP